MSGVHEVIGFGIVGLFAIGWLWPGGAWILRKDPGAAYWVWLTVAQVVAGLQVVIGVILLIAGYRPTTWLHYVYGAGPIFILVLAHNVARELGRGSADRAPTRPWVVFGFAAFICFGLTLRALVTGLGIG